jgi:hypothetical protein
MEGIRTFANHTHRQAQRIDFWPEVAVASLLAPFVVACSPVPVIQACRPAAGRPGPATQRTPTTTTTHAVRAH